jgi:hypothetical protein
MKVTGERMTDSGVRGLALALAAVVLGGCGRDGRLFPDVQTRDVIGAQYEKSSQPAIRQPVLPEMLVACRGHVLVPALGMLLLPKGKEPPPTGQYLREERLTAPYRILPPGARLSQEMSPTRLNVELDSQGRIIGLYCG